MAVRKSVEALKVSKCVQSDDSNCRLFKDRSSAVGIVRKQLRCKVLNLAPDIFFKALYIEAYHPEFASFMPEQSGSG